MNQKPLLLIIFSLFIFHFSLFAKEALPPLVKNGEPLTDEQSYYIDKRSPIFAVAISPDGKTIVSGSWDNSIKIWNSSTGKLIRSLEGHSGSVNSVALSNDGKTIVSGSYDKSIKLWNSSTGKLIRSLEGHRDAVSSVALSNDGKTIVSGSDDGSIKLWNSSTGKLIRSLEGHRDAVSSVALSNDGKTIVSGSYDKSIKLWNSSTGKLIRSLEGHTGSVSSVALSKDGKTIVSGSDDGSIKLWNSSTGKLIRSLEGHTNWVTSVALSNDGKTIVSGSADKSIKLWNRENGELLEELVGGVRGCWMVKKFNTSPKIFFRGDDGTFLFRRDGSTVTHKRPKWLPTDDNIEIDLITKELNIRNGAEKSMKIVITNRDRERLYYLKTDGYSDGYCTILPNRVSNLEAGEKQELSLVVKATLPNSNPKPIVGHNIRVPFVSSSGSEFNVTVPVTISYADINVTKAEVSEDRKNLNLNIENIGDEALKNAKVKLLEPFVSNVQDINFIEAKKSKPIAFAIDNNFSFEDNMSVALSVYIPNVKLEKENPKAEVEPAYVWQRENVKIVLNKLAWYIYALWVLTGVIVLWLIFYLRRYRNSLVLQLQREPKALLTLSPMLLSEAKKRLSTINELENILSSVGIKPTQLDEAISFNEQENKAALFAKRIPKSYLVAEGKQHKLACQKTELSVDDFLLYFTSKNANEIEEQFKEDGNRVFVVGSEEQREDIAKLARDKTNNIIAPTQAQWSEFLLSPKSQEVLMQILATCLEFSSISPYQTSKGVNKEVDFFGRIKIVRDIKMNSNRNYMIVGGRQLGKSSILKKLERSYAQSSSVDCRFINLEGKKGDIVLGMAQSFGLDEGATLEDVYNYIYQSDKKMLLLIDEVDEFVEPEIKRAYETLKTLKNLAEEGKATFVFAGYWTLYQYVVADYQSPLYNFGELIVLEGLEKEACRELMIEPMKRIGLRHEEVNYLDEVIEACGQRANLIATVCDEVLKEHEGKVIQKTELKKAMQSNSLRDKLLGWDNMKSLDKVIIYLTIEKRAFEFDEVLSLLEEEGLEVEASVVKKSLERLVIAYILKRDGGLFSYRVPIMRETVLKTNEKGRRALLGELVGKI